MIACRRKKSKVSFQGMRVWIDVHVKRPKAKCRKIDFYGLLPCFKRPDVDNFAKSVMDALTGIAWGDDGYGY